MKGEINILQPSRKVLRKMGYLRDQKGIMSRYLRESQGWESHIKNCRDIILESVHRNSPTNIVVLGSGWLLDFPLDEAYRHCREIVLLDVVHPSQILHKIKKYPGVSAEQMDLSGGIIHETYTLVKNGLGPDAFNSLNPMLVPLPVVSPSTLVISLNILSQLDSLPLEYIKRKTGLTYHDLHPFRSVIQENHLKLIKSVRGLLITDYREVYHSFSGDTPTDMDLLLSGKESIALIKEWEWEFDRSGVYRENCSTMMKVLAASF
jgi:hypothetical protein